LDCFFTRLDTGKGFETGGTEKEKRRMGTGIENVRTRLATLCSGTLDISSGDSGTSVTVRIPR
jgi:signal transduction histidine kinase